jgi:PHD/YefM family antitoxin component YafN of YafNO toxin-antitoxin module
MVTSTFEIDSLSNFLHRTKAFLKHLKKTGQPVILTINGKAELVVQDASSYQRLLRLVKIDESLEILGKSLRDVEAGRTQPMRPAIRNLGKHR